MIRHSASCVTVETRWHSQRRCSQVRIGQIPFPERPSIRKFCFKFPTKCPCQVPFRRRASPQCLRDFVQFRLRALATITCNAAVSRDGPFRAAIRASGDSKSGCGHFQPAVLASADVVDISRGELTVRNRAQLRRNTANTPSVAWCKKSGRFEYMRQD